MRIWAKTTALILSTSAAALVLHGLAAAQSLPGTPQYKGNSFKRGSDGDVIIEKAPPPETAPDAQKTVTPKKRVQTKSAPAPQKQPAKAAALTVQTPSARLFPPELPKPATADDIVAIRLANRGKAQASGPVTFGQVFAPGDWPKDAGIKAVIGDQPVTLQADIKARHDDGSVRHAILTLDSPAIAPGKTVDMMLRRAVPSAPQPSEQELTSIANRLGLTVDLTLTGTAKSIRLDAAKTLREAIAKQSVRNWLTGPLVREVSVTAPVTGNLRVIFHIRAYSQGFIETDIVFAADRAFTSGNENIVYDIRIAEAGQALLKRDRLDHHHKGTWHFLHRSPDRAAIAVIRDMDHFLTTGATPDYDFSMGTSEAVLNAGHSSLADADTGPMGMGTVTPAMPGTGGRADIGPLPTWAVRYLATQDERAASVLFANADAAGSIPWHYVDETTGEIASIDDHPKLWLDYRDKSEMLPALFTMKGTDWTTDVAHLPSLTYLPYLLTGSQYYRDEMQAAANYVMASMNPGYRGYQAGILDRHQLRGQAWGLREIANAAFILPDDHPMKGYFKDKLDRNLGHYLKNYAAPNPASEEISGAFRYPSGEPGKVSPWQDDYFAMVLGWIARRGDAKAQQLLDWKHNFTAGRFLAGDYGFAPIAGTSYRLNLYEIVNKQKQWFGTWQQIADATFTRQNKALPTTLNYPDWAGGYAALARAATASLTGNGDIKAVEAYGYIAAQTPNMPADYASDPTFSISAALRGVRIAKSDEYVGSAAADDMTGTDRPDLIHGAGGDDRIDGGGGIDALFGGDGDDVILGGDGDDVLFGNAGDDHLSGGNGNDMLKGGNGADRLEGGPGADVFVYAHVNDGGDNVTDFTPGEDRIDLRDLMRIAKQRGRVELIEQPDGLELWHRGRDGAKTMLALLRNVSEKDFRPNRDLMIP